MAVRVRRPSDPHLRSLLAEGVSDQFTYQPVGMSALAAPPHGYRLDRWVRSLGSGAGAFDRAREALQTWQVHRGAGLLVAADGPPTIDAVVAMAAPLPVGFVEVVCRVVDVVDERDRCGFSYGTRSNHPEQGEESFIVSRSAHGEITFEIVAVSRPRQVLARVFPPIARRLQQSATTRYLDAMQAAVDR